jgi:hypothetical protein
MSQTTLATVSIDLVTSNAAFLAGLSKSEASLKNSVKSMGNTISSFGSALSQSLGAVGGSIGAELSGIFSGLGSAVSEMSSKMSSAKGFAGALSIGLGGLAAVGIAAAASLSGLALSGGELAESLALTSQKTGLSVRDLQTWSAAGSVVGVNLDGIVEGMRKFSEALAGTGKGGAQLSGVLKELGVTSHDSNTALLQVATAFAKMPDGPVKSAAAVSLFGRSGLDLIPLLNKGAAGISQFSDIVSQFGPVVDKNAVDAMERWKTSTLKLSEAWDSLKVSLSGSVGVLSSIVDKMAQVTKGTGDALHVLAQHPKDALAGLLTGNIGLALSHVTASDVPSQPDDSKQHAEIVAQDALIAKYQERFNILKAGGVAQAALAQKEKDVAEDVANQNWQLAAADQAQIPALQQAATLEKQRLAAAKEMLDVLQRQSAGQIHVSNTYRQHAVPKAPELTPSIKAQDAQFSEISEALARLTNAGSISASLLEKGASDLDSFYDHWVTKSNETADTVNRKYDEEYNKLDGDFALGLISQKDFTTASIALEQGRQDALGKLGTGYAASFKSMFKSLSDEGDKLAGHLADALGSSIKALNDQLAQLATTGRASFASVAQGLEKSVISAGLQKLESSAIKGVGGLFGGKNPTGKADGSSSAPFYVKNADASIADKASGSIHKLNLGSIGKDISGAFKNIGGSLGSIFSKVGGGFGSIFGSLGSVFGGFRADGGSVSPGYSYTVGERGPERFVPQAAGRIVPNVSSTGSSQRPIQVNAHFHDVQNMDSFRQSKNQILGHLTNAVGRAASRR